MATTKGTKGIDVLMEQASVTVIRGTGRLDGPGRVIVTGDEDQTLQADKVILATGSMAAGLPGLEPDGERILTSDHLLEIDRVPASLIVLGAGAVGVELAGIMQTFGCKVTLVEMMDQILPLEDVECAEVVAKSLQRQGIKVHTGCRAGDVQIQPDGLTCRLTTGPDDEGREISAEHLLLAVGRKPVTRGPGPGDGGRGAGTGAASSRPTR